jgi:hypothetical protein
MIIALSILLSIALFFIVVTVYSYSVLINIGVPQDCIPDIIKLIKPEEAIPLFIAFVVIFSFVFYKMLV